MPCSRRTNGEHTRVRNRNNATVAGYGAGRNVIDAHKRPLKAHCVRRNVNVRVGGSWAIRARRNVTGIVFGIFSTFRDHLLYIVLVVDKKKKLVLLLRM